MVEIGGTVGDIESLPFLEAIWQLRIELGAGQTVFIHLTLVPYIPSALEGADAILVPGGFGRRGIAGIFLETHPRPDEALSGGPNAWPLFEMEGLLETLKAIDLAVKANSNPA